MTLEARIVAVLEAIGLDMKGVTAQVSGKVDKVAGKVLSSNDFTDTERVKLANIAEQATKNATDADLRDRSTHTGTQAISTVSGLQSALDAKEATGTAAGQLTAHTNAADPHPQYTTAAEAAAIAPVQSVAGRTGAVTLSKADVGLSAVDNTSDALKPVSTATQTALDTKAPISHVGSGGAAHSVATTSAAGFMAAADKTKLDGVASGATINATDAQLRDRATHTGAQAISTVTGLQTALDGKLNATNVGSAPNEVPSNQHLGALAFADTVGMLDVYQHAPDSRPNQLWYSYVSNTDIRLKFHGLDGVAREISLVGPQGPKGDTGATGATGPQGLKGDTGPKGDTGATGPIGPKGDKGDTGEIGPQGLKGDKGDKGDAADALAAVLTGLVTSDATGVLTTDNILQAIGKLQAQASGKVDKVAGKVLSSNDFTNTERVKLTNIAEQATKNAADADLRDRASHTGAQAISTVTGLQTALDGKLNSTNVGSSPAEVPSNQHLGALAFLDTLGATHVAQHARDSRPGDVWHEWVSNTQLRKKFHGFDGVIRTITETYA